MAAYGIAHTSFGPMLVASEGKRLLAVKFSVDAGQLPEAVDALHRELGGRYGLQRDDDAVAPFVRQLTDYLDGKRHGFDLDLDLSWVTPFRREVLLACRAIPRGQVATYGDLAERVGRPTAYRAVGNTMRTNPIPIVIPCHRVVGSSGSLTGFGGGLDMKRRLLALEGVAYPLPRPSHTPPA